MSTNLAGITFTPAVDVCDVFDLLLLLNSLVVATSSPVAMHATSSQSFVIHQSHSPTSPSNRGGGIGPSDIGQSSRSGQSNYEYKYEVSDHQTGDRKSHWETREGDKVRGAYTVYEPDGALRRVEYSADAVHGFNAIVTRNGETKHYPPPPPIQDPYSQRPTARVTDGYEPSSGGYIPERSTSGYAGGSRYQGQNSVDTGFSVNHLKLPGELEPKPY